MNDLSKFNVIERKVRPGDLIVFHGRGVLSGLISAFSNGPSHLGIVRVNYWDATGGRVVKLTESTIEGDRNGVQTNLLSERLASYDGSAWWLPLSDEIHAMIDWFKFYQFIGSTEDFVHYDKIGLFNFILRGLPIAGLHIGQEENHEQMVCSGFVAAVLESCGVLRGINWSKVSPQDIVEMKLYRECVQLVGSPGTLHNFNTI